MNREKIYHNETQSETTNNMESMHRKLFRKIGKLANGIVAMTMNAVDGISAKANRKESHERPIKDCGYYDREKYSLMGKEGIRQNEDASFIDEQNGVFGIFDGAGGVGAPGSGGIASRTARESFRRQVESRGVSSPGDLVDYLKKASRDVGRKTEGITTATVAKIVEENGQKFLYFAQVGDSRLYVVHKGDNTRKGWAEQISKDEGTRNQIYNWLGRDDTKEVYDKDGRRATQIKEDVVQFRRVPIQAGDRIVLCSDGVTGDINRRTEDGRNELMGVDEVARIVNQAGHPQMAARALVEQARKKDDRSAIVVEV